MSTTVVVVTHDRAAMLAQALASLTTQTEPPAAVVVVDDGSRDETPALLAGRSDLEVVRHDVPHGVAAARNAGLARVRTPWVAFLDDDDVWAPDKLAAQAAALRTDPTARWCYCGAMAIDRSLRAVGALRAAYAGDVRTRVLAANVVAGGGSSVVADTALVREVGGFDAVVTHYEDWDLWIRLALRSPVVAVDRPLVGYRRHPGGRTFLATGDAAGLVLRRYGRERAALAMTGSPEDPERSAREALLSAGRRWAGAREFLGAAARRRSPGLAVAGAATLVSPSLVTAVQQRRWQRQTPPDWFAEVDAWLPALQAHAAVAQDAADVGGKR